MKLSVKRRDIARKSTLRELRLSGMIPAVLYAKGKSGEALAVNRQEYLAHLRDLPKGRLSTARFLLVDESGEQCEAVLREVQYAVTTYEVLHLDFQLLEAGKQINIRIPLECVGEADCEGIKQGGVLRRTLRQMKVRCTPDQIPTSLIFNVQPLELGQSLRLNALTIPEGVTPMADLNQVAVAIVKR